MISCFNTSGPSRARRATPGRNSRVPRVLLPTSLLVAAAAVFGSVPLAAQEHGELAALEAFLAENVLQVVPPAERLAELEADVAERIERNEREVDSLRTSGEWERLDEIDRTFYEEQGRLTVADVIPQIEVLPGIGTLSLPTYGRFSASLNPWPWSVERDEDGLSVLVAVGGEPDRARVSLFDGETLELRPSGSHEGQVMVLVAIPDSVPAGRDEDAKQLVGEWTLVQVDEHTVEEHPVLTYSFRSDGTYEIDAADSPAGAATELSGTAPEGNWALSISRLETEDMTGDFEVVRFSGRQLALVWAEQGSQLFTITQLDEHNLTLRKSSFTGTALLRFER